MTHRWHFSLFSGGKSTYWCSRCGKSATGGGPMFWDRLAGWFPKWFGCRSQT